MVDDNLPRLDLLYLFFLRLYASRAFCFLASYAALFFASLPVTALAFSSVDFTVSAVYDSSPIDGASADAALAFSKASFFLCFAASLSS